MINYEIFLTILYVMVDDFGKSHVVAEILEIRREFQLGALRSACYLARCHGIQVSESKVTRVLGAHGVGQLRKTAPRRVLSTKQQGLPHLADLFNSGY